MSNILITGIGGFIGANMANYLSQNENNHVYGLIRSLKVVSTLRALKLEEKKNVTIVFGNVNVYPDIENIVTQNDIDIIYHFASQPIVKNAPKSPTNTFIINNIGTMNVLEVVRLMKSTLGKEVTTLIQSTDKVYGESTKLPYLETDSFNCVDIYSTSKACTDLMARSYAYTYDLPITISRPCNTYGSYDFNWSRIIPTLAKVCLDKKQTDSQLVLNKYSYHQIREYIYITDLIEALISLTDNINTTKGEAYNISSNYSLATRQVVERFFELSNTNKDIEFTEKDVTFVEIENQRLSTDKIREHTGWKPKYNFDESMTIVIENYKKWFGEFNEPVFSPEQELNPE